MDAYGESNTSIQTVLAQFQSFSLLPKVQKIFDRKRQTERRETKERQEWHICKNERSVYRNTMS